MKVIREISELREFSIKQRSEGKTVGLVPTMGFLHSGHASLIELSDSKCDITITTLFVNPTQFAPHEDYDSYPRDFEHDYNIAKKAGSDVLFAPSRDEMYDDFHTTTVRVGELASIFEGKPRPHFFDGVATVVAKLFNASIPTHAFFGQKDYQQSLVVRRLESNMRYGIEIVVAPIVREENGLAMSSRNKYLTEQQKEDAGILHSSLLVTKQFIESGERNRKLINAFLLEKLRKLDTLKVDYAVSANGDDLSEPTVFEEGEKIVLLIGAILGKTRLIDNMVVISPTTKYNEDTRFVEGL
ncbi:MAG: pantoate--beta-alanine ligase [Chlorobiota bacterium]